MNFIFKNKTFKLLIVLSVSILISPVSLANSWTDNLNFNGFYTIDLTYTDDDLALTSSDLFLRHFTKDSLSINNSLLGGQLEYEFNDQISLFLQGALFVDNRDSFKANIDWAYLNYTFGNDHSIRIGKFQIPFLQGTELKKVGSSRLWARPLIPGDGAGGFNEFQGVEYLKKLSVENNNWDFQLSLGTAEHDLAEIENKNIKLISAKYQHENTWVRGALLHIDYSVFTPNGLPIMENAEALMLSIEAETMIDSFVFNAGISNADTEITPNDSMKYFSLGYNFNKFTPYILAVHKKQDFTAFDPPTPPGGNPPGMGPPPPPDGESNSYNYAIGTRFFLNETTSLKIQFENIKLRDESRMQSGIIASHGNAFSIIFEGVF